MADVGCGDGALTRFMARAGARAIGIECSPAQLARCRAAAQGGGGRYLAARGEALPLATSSSIEDETAVRAAAYEALRDAAARGLFVAEAEQRYRAPFRHLSFDSWKARAASPPLPKRATGPTGSPSRAGSTC